MFPVILPSFVHLAAAEVQQCVSQLCDTGLPAVDGGNSQLSIILQIVFAIIGAVALINIILSGFKLVISLGNPEALAKARNTIVFAAIGLAIAVSAEILVSLLLNRL